MKKTIILSILLSSFLLADGLEYKGNIGVESSYIDHDIANKRDSQNALRLELELKQKTANGQMVLNAEAIVDVKDKNRRYVDVNDLYYKHDFENSDLLRTHVFGVRWSFTIIRMLLIPKIGETIHLIMTRK